VYEESKSIPGGGAMNPMHGNRILRVPPLDVLVVVDYYISCHGRVCKEDWGIQGKVPKDAKRAEKLAH
jgi:hypothetical protein